jgi:hypothetical protein
MKNLRLLAVLGVVAVLGMTGCHKEKQARNGNRTDRRELRQEVGRKDHRTTKRNAKKQARNAKRNRAEREERNIFAK